MIKFFLFALLMAFAAPAAAAVKISEMNPASALTGAEMYECVQSSATKRCTATQMQTFITGNLGTTSPATNDGGALGTTSLKWSDLFLASGAVINFNSGDVTLTHSTDTLTLGGGNLALGTGLLTAGGATITNTGTQLTLAYDVSNSMSISVSNAGVATLDSTATTMTFNDQIAATLGIKTTGSTDSSNFVARAGAASATTATTEYQVGGATATFMRAGVRGSTATTLTSGASYASFIVGQNPVTEFTSGNHPVIANMAILTVQPTNGAATSGIGTNLFIDAAPTGTYTDGPYSFYSAGAIKVNAAVTATTIELGAASDTTLARSGAGSVTIEGNAIYRAGGTDVPVADGGTGASTAAAARANLGFRADEYCWAASDFNTTTITAATSLAIEYLPAAFTVTGVRAYVRTAPSGLMTIDINEAGATILSTKLTIDSGEKTSGTAATAAVISDTAIAANAEITVDVDSTTAGKGLVVCMEGSF